LAVKQILQINEKKHGKLLQNYGPGNFFEEKKSKNGQ